MNTEILAGRITKLESENTDIRRSNEWLRFKLEQYIVGLLPRATKKAHEFIDKHEFEKVTILPSEYLKSLECQNKEMKTELEVLKTEDSKLIDEPIRIAEKLIYATNKYPVSQIQKALGCKEDMVDIDVYSKSDLRQIANHLLVYCDSEVDDE